MTPEIQDVFQFVYKQAPFSELPEAAASYFSKHIEIVYLSQTNQQDWLQDGKPNLYLLRSGVVDLISAKDEVIGRMSEGDYFGYPSLLTGDAIQNRIEVQKDGLVYILNEQNFDFLRREYKPFEQYFVRAHANRLLSSRYKQQSETWSERKISELMTKDAVTIGPTASIREAAKLMSQHRVSSIMVTEQARLVGVVTDRDLRNRVLAQDKDPSAPLAEIMTEKPKHIFENNRVFSALHLMLKHNIHHLPVLNEAYKPLGMLTSTDLLRQQKSDPVQLIGRIYKAQNLLAIKSCAQEIPDLLRQFSYHIEDISLIGKLLSGLTDALTSRLIYLYQQQHGAAPCRFAWICFGSQAREEQTLHSDQDNGLLLPDNISENDSRYFAALGAFVCEQLNECGIQSCPGNIMASNIDCRGTVAQWTAKFSNWILSPTPKAMLNCKIYFDMRFIDGASDLYATLRQSLDQISRNELFYAAMATDINANSVPIGIFQQFKLEKDKSKHKYLDLKKRGVAIINDVVRLYALKVGVARANTLERLEALTKSPLLAKSDIDNLKDCWRFLTQLRLKTQINREGLPGNCINPENLSSLERHQLKEAFYLVKQAQQASAFKFARGSL
ncbi:CBS domain-containing protein [Pseudoalteromonas piscicida]|uniref:CBS domain-containing protein n=1 Tax=Pseudoalteromonas piscicida TaxID=43662 RepID=A0AAQ2IR36_PSEO7|nr:MULTISPECIES: DUF294 nucleotidyltransferase-like domain-containing protein [Pseudoalteromonas]KJY86205.1 inosine-5-monophosphate dehydrogenase [Pseudoalteromonas piscicida]TMN34812.1 CBS domain-containing protein [Pseudoalteromonas piscicida]TMN41885.1 CBS domain-containing protein [Pseudoalteromonas piscicida]TMN48228.1 CBS domain-containing protein [Pseudoalteromonas piscicida]TMN52273.1 CBS domain-containing protein [Pseudoalteromonas piscicida]